MLAFTREHVQVSGGDSQLDTLADPDALFALYRPRVLGLCRRILGGNGAVEDACQEALAKAYEALPKFRDGAPMWPWLATITANVCRDLLRRDRPTEPIEAAESSCEATTWSDPERAAASRGRTRLVHDAMTSLPAAYGTPLYLREIEGWSYAQIAEMCGRTVASVRTTLMRGRRLLAARIEDLARERHEWPLPGVSVLGMWIRRARARAGRMQATLEGMVGQWWRVDSMMAGLASLTMSVIAPAVAAVAIVVLPGGGAIEPSRATPETREVAVEGDPIAAVVDDRAPSAATPRPADPRSPTPMLQVGTPEIQADSDARLVTPTVEATASPLPPEASPGGASDGTVYAGPIGVACGPQDGRREGMALLCSALGD